MRRVRTLLLMAVGVVAVSMSGPLMAAMVVPPLAIAFWRNAFATAESGQAIAGLACLPGGDPTGGLLGECPLAGSALAADDEFFEIRVFRFLRSVRVLHC